MQIGIQRKIQASVMMLILVAVLLIPFVNLNIGKQLPLSSRENVNWWNPDWPYRKLLTIDHTKVYADLVNFPVLLSLSSDADLAAATQSLGQDIAFILYSDNSTKLNHEIEYFNHGNGQLIAWVNLSMVSFANDTKFWMYFGNTNCGDQQSVEATWNSNFLAVHHLEETSGTVFDSTSHNYDGIPYGSLNQTATGKVDGADYFDGVDDHITLPAVYTSETQFTFETWIYAQPGARHFISQRSNISQQGVFIQILGDSYLQYFINGVSDITSISLNTWNYVALAYNGSMAHLYLNGVLNSIISTPPTWPSDGMCIGDRIAGSRQFHGAIDEVRFSNIARTGNWLNTVYNNQNNPESFITVGTLAQYEYNLNLMVEPSEGGTIEQSPAPPYHYNDIITLTALPNQSYIFDHWGGNLSGNTNPTTITMNENKTVIASFLLQNITPVAVDDSITVNENSTNNTIDVLVNDYDPNGDNLTIISLTQPLHGTSFEDGSYVYYTPIPGYSGSDDFTYTITDGQDGNATATVTVTVIPLNSPPYPPSNPSPGDDDINVSIATDLIWVGGDPDVGDTVRYDVYFGTTSVPLKVASNQSFTTYNLGVLAYSTQYFWYIVSWDSHGSSTKGELWSFTTQSEPSAGIVVNITRPLENSFYFRNLRLFSLPRNTIVYGPIIIKAQVTADSEIDRVEFYIDGKLKKVDTRPPYTYRWAPLRCFRHEILVQAYDVNANTASDQLTVFKWRAHPILLLTGAYLLLSASK
jgi:hypothetical protein